MVIFNIEKKMEIRFAKINFDIHKLFFSKMYFYSLLFVKFIASFLSYSSGISGILGGKLMKFLAKINEYQMI